MIKEAIKELVNGKDLDSITMESVMEEIMTGEATDAQKASFFDCLSCQRRNDRRDYGSRKSYESTLYRIS